jgi:hypothetical protein
METSIELLELVFSNADEDRLLSNIPFCRLSNSQAENLFIIGRKNKKIRLCLELSKNLHLSKLFSFLGNGVAQNWIESGHLEMLPIPLFQAKNVSSQEIIQLLIGKDCNRYVIRRFHEILFQYGIRGWNNFFILKKIYKEQFDLNAFFELIHDVDLIYLKNSNHFRPDFLNDVFSHFGIRRTSKMLAQVDYKINLYCNNLVHDLTKSQKSEILSSLPSKPRSFQEIFSFIEKAACNFMIPNIELNMPIKKFDRKKFGDFMISIPKCISEVRALGEAFNNCLPRYPYRLRRGLSELLVLEKNQKAQVIVEVKFFEKYEIIQLQKNSDSNIQENELKINLENFLNNSIE